MSEFKEFGKISRLNREIVITEKIDGTNAQLLIEPIQLEQPEPNYVAGRGGNNPVGDEIAVVKLSDTVAFGVYAGSRSRWLVDNGTKSWDNYGFGAWVRANARALVELFGPGRHFGEWWGAGIQRRYGQTPEAAFDDDRCVTDAGPDHVEGCGCRPATTGRRFSLFNVARYGAVDFYLDPRCRVPVADGVSPILGDDVVVSHKVVKGQKVCACREAHSAIDTVIGGVRIDSVPVIYRGPWITDGEHMLGAYPAGTWAPTAARGVLRHGGSLAAPGFIKPEGIVVFHEASGVLFKATLENDEKPKGLA